MIGLSPDYMTAPEAATTISSKQAGQSLTLLSKASVKTHVNDHLVNLEYSFGNYRRGLSRFGLIQ